MSLFLPLLPLIFTPPRAITTTRPTSVRRAHACAVIVRQPRSRSLLAAGDAWRQWLSHVTGPVVIDGDPSIPFNKPGPFLRRLSAIFPRIFCNDRVAKTAQYFRKVTQNSSFESLIEQYPLPIAEQLPTGRPVMPRELPSLMQRGR